MQDVHDVANIDLLDPGLYAQGHPFGVLMWLQENHPVYWHAADRTGGSGFWVLTRYEDVRAIHGRPGLFSSEPTTVISDQYTYGDGYHSMMMFSDPPRHTTRRRFLGEELIPKSVLGMAPRVRTVVNDVIDSVIEQGECDLVSDIAGKMASWVTADVMGLPRSALVEMYELTDQMITADSLTSGIGLEAATKIYEYGKSVWDDRRACPRSDMVTRLTQSGGVPDWPSDLEQFTIDFSLIFNAAGDTTRNVISGGMHVLFENRDQWEQLATDPDLAPAAVEELLRWVTPIVYQRRTVKDDTRIRGFDIRAGDKVTTFLGAANRDPRVFGDPFKLDLRRNPNNHVTFGFGPHFCLGAHLARLELRLMFSELARRMSDLEPAGPTEWVREDYKSKVAPIMVGPQAMPVRFRPGPRESK